MGVVERRKREIERRRERAIDAAMELYREEGYHAVTMEKIAERSELSRAALYLYFNTKDEIFISAIVTHAEHFAELLQDIYNRREALKPRLLDKLWESFQSFYQEDPVSFNASLYFHQNEMIRNLPENLRDMLYQSGSKIARLQHKIVKYGVEAGVFIQCNPMPLSEVIWTSFSGIIQLEHSKHAISQKSHLETTRDLAIKILSRGALNHQANDPRGGAEIDSSKTEVQKK